MASWIRALLTSTLLAFCIATPSAQAASAPIVFDFEDGLQGWAIFGSPQRVQTQVLGGDWAIFADGRVRTLSVGARGVILPGQDPSIEIEMDLTDIASISLEQFFVEGNEDNLFFINGVFSRLDVIEPGNPSLRAVDVSSVTGVTEVRFFWGFPTVDEGLPPPIVAFIDNITFHPVPEPSSWLFLSLGIAGVGMIRRKLASRV